MTSFEFSVEDGTERRVLIFKAFENGCVGETTLDVEMVDANGKSVYVKDIPEFQLRQLAAYLNASLTQRRY